VLVGVNYLFIPTSVTITDVMAVQVKAASRAETNIMHATETRIAPTAPPPTRPKVQVCGQVEFR